MKTAFELVNDLFKKKGVDLDRPHHYRWIENKELPIEDERHFMIEIHYEDTECKCDR